MASLENKLTGEVCTGYASDSDEERLANESGHSDNEDNDVPKQSDEMPENINDLPDIASSGPKTGPKGVLQDYKRYKQLERLENIEATKEKITLHKQLAFTADPNKHSDKQDEDDEDFEDDEFIKQYHAQRLAQMQQELEKSVTSGCQRFEEVYELNAPEFVDVIEKTDENVVLIIHLYEQSLTACKQMNKCFDVLAKQYPYVKFCKVQATNAGLSLKFKLNALPALQIYKGGSLIGNFIKMQDKLDQEFYASDVENFLLDSDMLTTGNKPALTSKNELCDSDYELD